MSRSRRLLTVSAFLLALSQAHAEKANSAVGIWLTEAGDAKVRISYCGAGLCGTIIWLKVPIDPSTGKPQVDDKNANPSLAKRPIIGINIFGGMKSVTNSKWSGTIYNADNGKTYSSEVIVAGPRKLEVRGCVMSILCGGETWTKIGEVTIADANN